MTTPTASSWGWAEEDPVAVTMNRSPGHIRWEAAERHGITPSPGTLAFVHDLLNTRRSDDGRPDLLASGDAAQRWADGAVHAWSSVSGRPHVPCRIGIEDAAALRNLRDVLGTSVRHRTMPDARHTTAIELIFEGGEANWHPVGEGVERLRSIVLGEVLDSQRRGTWPRLRPCRHACCGVTFFDRTWDQRQIWHDTTKPQSQWHSDGLGDRI